MNSISKSLITLGIIFCLSIPFLSFSQDYKNLDIALRHLSENAKDLNLTETDISNYRVSDHYVSVHNGVTHIYLQQQHESINVRNALININILPNDKVLNFGNRFVSDLANRINTISPSITPDVAVQYAMNKFLPSNKNSVHLKERKSEQHFIYKNEGIALEPIEVKLLFNLLENKEVRLVWQVELYQLDAQHWWEAQVDAKTGEILTYRDKVIHCSFDDPNASCKIDHVHTENHNNKNTSKDISLKSNAAPVMGNSYFVLPIPVESPNHGVHELVVDPADLTASPFGWHDTDGVDGPEFTITRGNNVHAYQDIFDLNGSIGDEPDGGATLDFDFPFDPANNNPYTQVDGAVVNLFYWNNVIHDLWYHYGFDEVSGNFQENNYGNGGQDGDYVRAEALDGSGRNNANFAPTTDGNRPRMQMYIWSNDNLPAPPPEIITITAPAGAVGDYDMAPAGFGGALPLIPLEAELVLVDDGVGTTSDACDSPIENAAEISGKIALIDRGNCQFGIKMQAAEDAGAVGVIVCQNLNEAPFPMGIGDFGAGVTIPGVMISMQDCDLLKMNLTGLTVSLFAPVGAIPTPGPAGRDGDFDNGIVVHEFTHGISSRLTGGPSSGGCLTNAEQAGEGWSDWFGLVMQTTSANSANDPRGIGTFAINEPITGDGIRDNPYSRDMNIDDHTYGDVNNLAVPHGVGSVWAVMIWDLYWNMVDLYGFDNDLYNGEGGNNKTMQLVLDGLKLQACNPTFIDARDAILAADVADFGGIHQCLIWETFARRGLGVDAVAGGGESFDTPDFCNFTLKVSKTAAAEVDAGSVLTYTVVVRNDTEETANDFVVTDNLPDGTELIAGSVSCGSATVDNNILSINLGDVMAGEVITCNYNVLVASAPFSEVAFEDDVENGTANWDATATAGPVDWGLSGNSFDGNFAWFVENSDTISDVRLTSTQSFQLTGDSASLVFWHRYNTESTWDGGVVEISTDGGNFWDDLGVDMIQNGYNNNIMDNDASPISTQAAFTGNSGTYIQTIIDLSSYSGEEALFRFRFASDAFVGGEGWFIDNVVLYNEFHAITNVACIDNNGEEVCSEMTTVVFGNTTSTNNIEEAIDVSVFPNPTDGKIFIKMNNNNNSSASFKLVGLDGRLLRTKEVDSSNGTFDFDLTGFPSGIYTLQIQTDEAQVIRKVVVQ